MTCNIEYSYTGNITKKYKYFYIFTSIFAVPGLYSSTYICIYISTYTGPVHKKKNLSINFLKLFLKMIFLPSSLSQSYPVDTLKKKLISICWNTQCVFACADVQICK